MPVKPKTPGNRPRLQCGIVFEKEQCGGDLGAAGRTPRLISVSPISPITAKNSPQSVKTPQLSIRTIANIHAVHMYLLAILESRDLEYAMN